MDTALSPNERRRKRRAEQALADALYDPTEITDPSEFKVSVAIKPIPVQKRSRYNDESKLTLRKITEAKDTRVASQAKVTQPVKKRARKEIKETKDLVQKPSIVYQQECEDWANFESSMSEASRNLSYSMADDVASYICSQADVDEKKKHETAPKQVPRAAILPPPSFDSIPPPSLYRGLDGESELEHSQERYKVLYGQVQAKEKEPAEQVLDVPVEAEQIQAEQEQSLHLSSFEFEPPQVITASKSKANVSVNAKARELDGKHANIKQSSTTDAQRVAYEDILNKQLLHKSEPMWWREQFHLIGRKMVRDVEKIIEAKVSSGAKINPSRMAAFTERQSSQASGSVSCSASQTRQVAKGKQDILSPILVGGGYCSSMEPSPRASSTTSKRVVVGSLATTGSESKAKSGNKADADGEAMSSAAYTVGYKGTLYSFMNEVLIGRQEGCDIRLTEAKDGDCFSSRIQMALYPLPKYNMICIVDLGSLNGLKQTKRADIARPCEQSCNGARKNILIGWPEWSVLEMGGVQSRQELLVIFPKECLICMSAPRDYKFDKCGHYCVCIECVRQLDACPLCRKADQEIVQVDPGMETAVAPSRKKRRVDRGLL